MVRAIAVAMVVTCACVSSANRFGPTAPVVERSAADEGQLYKSALRALSDRGLSAATNDRDAGVIVSEWETMTEMGADYRYRWRITVDAGEVRVVSDGQSRLADDSILKGAAWERMTDQPNHRMATARSLARQIASEPGAAAATAE